MKSTYDIIVIGAGAGGLVVAIGAARAGKKVLLIEKGHWGGDCTNFGCIPSKSLIASSHAAYALQEGKALGLEFESKAFQGAQALERVRHVVADIRSHEDPEALRQKGVDTLEGEASFVDPYTVKVRSTTIDAKQIVIATGSAPVTPPVPDWKGLPFSLMRRFLRLKRSRGISL